MMGPMGGNNPMMAMMMSLALPCFTLSGTISCFLLDFRVSLVRRIGRRMNMMNMQQMMAKAGGAPPQPGMNAMNPMAAMMGASAG